MSAAQQLDLEGRLAAVVDDDSVIGALQAGEVIVNGPNEVTAPPVTVIGGAPAATLPGWLLALLAVGAWLMVK